ncbi:vWA domain-containing protein [Nocardioides mesophilus]|uniref:VWA domain-containing protein n=1 Tax=Nocardioides mesophilus TaxID=433659 RepID=A0A7G9RDY7_9ACTN|nr:VWA domain-containing protein [Nocardioides mesophilus]QNN53812.1 VWA domain-containing protein [Nocardioides mesophilus]
MERAAELVHAPDELLLGFARALRAAGVPVTMDRAQTFLRATALVDLGDQRATYWAGRATLCSGPDDLDRFDQVFTAWFQGKDRPGEKSRPPERPPVAQAALEETDRGGAGEEDDTDPLRATASGNEVLRHRDIDGMSPLDKGRLAALFETLRPRTPMRRAHRQLPWHRGRVDADRTLRLMLSRMGEPAEIAWRRRTQRPRRVVLLLDVSGSMSPYADALLRLAHRFSSAARDQGAKGRVETFTVGTRLTRITRAMGLRDPERAIVAAGETVPDWSGGTRLGETLQIFLDRWGQRGLARGAVVVIFSDGWERGDTTLLGEQMRRLHSLAHRVVWVNPHVGKAGYQPVQAGIVASLAHVDDFVAGHSLATFEDLIEVVAHA